MTEIEKERDELRQKLVRENAQRKWLEGELKECANELCLKCGSYREEHLGACDGCRWRNARYGDFE